MRQPSEVYTHLPESQSARPDVRWSIVAAGSETESGATLPSALSPSAPVSAARRVGIWPGANANARILGCSSVDFHYDLIRKGNEEKGVGIYRGR